MQEEFHAEKYPEGPFKQLYGWGSINANVWLPSLSELVGTIGTADDTTGCYQSTMQGLNLSSAYWTDTQGGAQFAYFQQHNAQDGGEVIIKTCNQEPSWTRSCTMETPEYVWRTTNAQRFDWGIATASYAVRPVVGTSYVSFAYPQRTGEKLIHSTVSPFCGEGHIGNKLILLFLSYFFSYSLNTLS